ncbi:glycogen/starch/alpha-glucan phosphorylase [Anaerorhabdus sp.]|uniref:glycogen/starch/alpha-glucan phosphorylase n=1 Tax=Anaerorhabdus sp. TaxID=1872524 RepID=UPI002FCB46C5
MFKSKEEFIKEFELRVAEMYGRSIEQSHRTEKYMALGEMVREYASLNWKASKEKVAKSEDKQMFYFSMEFLIGRLLTNNLMNLGIYNIVKEGLEEIGIDINELEDLESDAGLGNGGLGRLAACFLDSLASLRLPGNGNCIRYQYGLFKQKIDSEGNQVEVPDQWLRLGNVWEVRKPKHAVDIKFGGHVNVSQDEHGHFVFDHVDCEHITAVPYDMPIIGRGTNETNTLRLWSAEASEIIPANKDFRKYLAEVQEICLNVYPDDSTPEGKILRLKQQYFFVCAGLNAIIRAHLRVYPNLDNLADKVAIQLNDTHPVLAIPELMRILMDEHHYEWMDAWNIVVKVMAYTNHTILQEALEKWPVDYVRQLLPRIYMIIEEINARFQNVVREEYPGDNDMAYRVAIIRDNQVHMANLAVIGSHSINGVAQIHSEIIKKDLFKDFVKIYSERFNNKTNGITQRRWLYYSNPQLTKLISETIGDEFLSDFDHIENLMKHVEDTKLQKDFLVVKQQRKEILAKVILDKTGIEVNPNTIFDVQAKRLHAYKRQLLNVLHIIYQYQRLKSDPTYSIEPRTYIFAAKAAPAYVFAKKVIKLINKLSMVINNDPQVNDKLKVVFIPNYSVSIAEVLMNAADVSEQISTAGKEASGTGNMKFMMNGALTLGTLDGANVEIDELVGRDNDVIFGLTVDEVMAIKPTYQARQYYEKDERIKHAVDSLIDGTWSSNKEEFKIIYDELLYRNDEYLLLADFDAYVKAQEAVEVKYRDQAGWAKSCLINIAKSGYFSSDRTIKQYADDIWHIHQVKI